MSSLSRLKPRLAGYKGEGETCASQDLRSAFAANSSWTRCAFSDVKFDLANFEGSVFEDVVFTDCDARIANFRFCNKIRNVVFEECDLEQAIFSGASLDGVVFKYCRLSLSTFERSVLRDVVFDGCNLHGADLRYYRASKVAYRDSNLWGVNVAIGCQFFNGEFDERSRRFFAGILARTWPVSEDRTKISEVAGEKLAVVERLMNEEEEKA